MSSVLQAQKPYQRADHFSGGGSTKAIGIAIFGNDMSGFSSKFGSVVLLSALGPLAFVGVAGAIRLGSVSDHLISQRGKRFGPEEVSLRTGEHITIVNDDSNFVHHAYVDTEEFAFDSGDIEPGTRAVIAFTREGDFTVLCGVHPRMKLAVHVRQADRP